MTEECHDLQYCILELLELGLWSFEECRKIIETMEDLSFLLELDEDRSRNHQSKKWHTVYFKGNFREVAVSRCKIMALCWIQMLDEMDGKYKKSKQVLQIPFTRLLSCKVGLFKMLETCLNKKIKFREDLAEDPDRNLIKEFTEQPLEGYLAEEDVIEKFQNSTLLIDANFF